jgi:hypothetical protein
VTGVKALDGTTDYALTGNTAVSVVVTPGAGQSFPVGAQLRAYTDATCATAVGGSGTTTVTTGTATAAQTVVVTAANAVANDTFQVICMSAPVGAGNLATPIQPTLAATVTPGTATNAIGVASGTGYNLQYNGSTVTVNSYWPGALSGFNFTGYLRVTNTGSVPAAVSLAHLSPTNGGAGTSSVIISSLAAGETRLLTSAQVDALVGAAPSGLTAGRVRVTAPTDGLRVQSMLQFNNGNLVEFANN